MNMMKKASKSVVGVESDGGPSPSPPPKRSSQCPPLVVAPAHGTLRLVPLAPPTGNGSASSSSSSSTRNSYLMEVDGRRRPVQITADPRVYRGSVFANRRLANDRARQAEQAESKEKRYRVGVMREQLTNLLPRVDLGGANMHYSAERGTQQQRISSNRKTRQSTHLPDISAPRNGSIVNFGASSIDKSRGKNFTTARFVPVRSTPNVGNGDIFGKPAATQPPPINSTTNTNTTSHFPVKVVVNFETANTRPPEMADSLQKRRSKSHVTVSQTATPPSSARPLYPIVDSGVQTDDNFDLKFEELVKELANSAIEMAQINLEAENELAEVRKAAEVAEQELRAITRKQNVDSANWKRQILLKNEELEAWKKNDANAREAQKLAQLTCEEVTRKTLENLKMIEQNSKRSIGLDTRDMVVLAQKMTLVTAELEKDFFPWIFRRAERLFRHQIAKSQLDHSVLNEQFYRREQAKRRLINFNSQAI